MYLIIISARFVFIRSMLVVLGKKKEIWTTYEVQKN